MLGVEVLITALVAVLGGLLALSALQTKAAVAVGTVFSGTGDGTSFLFDGETLIDATPGARALLSLSQAKGGPWLRLLAYLTPQFPGIEAQFACLPGQGSIALAAAGAAQPPLLLRAELRGGLTRISLLDPEDDVEMPGIDPLTQRATQAELDQLRNTVMQAPLLVWRENREGAIIWANAAYLNRVGERLEAGEDLTWPLPRLFEPTATQQGAKGQRQKLENSGSGAQWFDLIGLDDGLERLLFGLPADAAVQAETSLHEFMQTLTKTFAHLPIGLAIFDRQRQMALFNPALMDLSGLQADFLSLRPTLFAFLDAMRDRNMIPEPKDYHSWRKQMSELEKAATSGLYEETWSLPSGQTYRVIGRPHPNGALALMFEDISTEMSRTRRYRADLELGQAVVDALDQAVAVFSQAGLLVMSNTAYSAVWDHDPAASLGEGGIANISAYWRDHSAPSPIWAEVEAFVADLGVRTAWGADARLQNGRLIHCHFAPLPGGATLATFRLVAPETAQAPDSVTAKRRRSA